MAGTLDVLRIGPEASILAVQDLGTAVGWLYLCLAEGTIFDSIPDDFFSRF